MINDAEQKKICKKANKNSLIKKNVLTFMVMLKHENETINFYIETGN